MIRTIAVSVLVLGLMGSSWAVADPGRDAAMSPSGYMRTLQSLQEQIARGNGAAQAAQPKLMTHIAERFLAADPSVWREPKNARAAVLFLLSGGKPSVIRAVLAKGSVPQEFDALIKGALAYGEGDDEAARKILGDIDPRTLPSVLGGHLALVQATLLSDEDNQKAGKLLDLARLLVPGTLVEEAALRRQIFSLVGPETFDKFVFLSRDYIRRYRNSVYADNFKQRLSSAASRLAALGDVAALSKFDSILGELPVSERLAYQLAIARVALIQGKTAAARSAAEKAAVLAAAASPDGIRSRLYAGAALIVSDNTSAGIKSLEEIDRSRLSAQDAELRDAAMAVAASVRAEAPAAGAAVGNDDSSGGTAGGPSSDPLASATIERARTAIADTDNLLKGAQQ